MSEGPPGGRSRPIDPAVMQMMATNNARSLVKDRANTTLASGQKLKDATACEIRAEAARLLSIADAMPNDTATVSKCRKAKEIAGL